MQKRQGRISQTFTRVATKRSKSVHQTVIPPSHSLLTPGQPDPTLTPSLQECNRVITMQRTNVRSQVPVLGSLGKRGVMHGSPALSGSERDRNQWPWERAGQEPVAKQILRRKWGWTGHTLRKPASSTTRQALTWNPQGKRKRGRPRNSWRRDTEAELKLQGTNWSGMTRAAQNRVRWRGGR